MYKRQSIGTLRQLVGQRIAAEGVNQVEDSRRITLYGARENEIIDYFPPFLILFVVVLLSLIHISSFAKPLELCYDKNIPVQTQKGGAALKRVLTALILDVFIIA